MIYTLLISTTAVMLLSVLIFDRDITAPAFLMSASLCIAELVACFYADKWKLRDYRLLIIVLSGLIGFVLFCSITYLLDSNFGKRKVKIRDIKYIEITSGKLVIYLTFQIVIYASIIIYVLKYSGASLLSISSAIQNYYEDYRLGTIKNSLPRIIDICNILNTYFTYFIIYIHINNNRVKRHDHKDTLLLINIIVALAGSLITGTKTSFFMYIIGWACIYVITANIQNGWKLKINYKLLFRSVALLAISLIMFIALNNIQGRQTDHLLAIDTIASYIGAPLKNLEIFINKYTPGSSRVFGIQTLSYTYSDIYELTNNPKYLPANFYRYNWINGFGLGNVYTQFMPIYYDFGVFGLFVVMGLLGIFCQKIYDKIKYGKSNKYINHLLIFYSYLSFAICFTFFSNKFFECIFSKSGLYFLIGVYLADALFTRIKRKATNKFVMIINRNLDCD